VDKQYLCLLVSSSLKLVVFFILLPPHYNTYCKLLEQVRILFTGGKMMPSMCYDQSAHIGTIIYITGELDRILSLQELSGTIFMVL
jgi:hypothetical protein